MSNRFFFDPDIAKRVGIREAVVYEYIRFWCEKNRRSNRNLHDGYHWTYGSASKISESMPFISKKQIWLSIKNLHKADLIDIGRYNKKNYDRTAWYRIKEKK